MNFKKTLSLAAVALLLALSLDAAPKPKATPVPTGPKAPEKLSDLYKIFNAGLREGLGTEVQAWPIRIQGRSWELFQSGQFSEVELILKPFKTQGLSFEKAEILFRRLAVDTEALNDWKLKFKEVREVESRLIFSMRSLAQKLSEAAGKELTLKADAEAQTVILSGPGSFFFIPCTVEATCEPRWDDSKKQLRLVPKELRFGGRHIWRIFWWLGSYPVSQEPVLDLGFSWIPFNIQEVHVSWDRVNLTTNW